MVFISEGMQQQHEYVESEADLGDCETAVRVGKSRGPPLMHLEREREDGTGNFSLLRFFVTSANSFEYSRSRQR